MTGIPLFHRGAAMLLAWGPAPTDGGAEELGWLTDAPWGRVAVIVAIAVVVFTLGTGFTKRLGRGRAAARRRPDFDLRIAKLESLPPTSIADANDGPVHIEGVIASANETLGGPPERARVYFNQKGAGRKAAVAAELVVVRDATGQVAIEDLEAARVIAASDGKPARPDARPTYSLRLGDRVQLLGDFRREVHAKKNEAAKDGIFGVMGDQGQIQVRLLERPRDESAEAQAASEPEAEPAEDAPRQPQPAVDTGPTPKDLTLEDATARES